MSNYRPFNRLLATSLSVALIVLASACSDDSPPPFDVDSDRDATTDPPPEDETDLPADEDTRDPVTLTLRVQHHAVDFLAPRDAPPLKRFPHAYSVDLALRDDTPAVHPVANVRVALDGPDGARLGEADSDAEGLVLFALDEDLWPENAALSATAYHSDFMMHTVGGITRPSSAAPLPMTIRPRREEPGYETVRIEGECLNARVGSTGLLVMSTAPYGGWFNGPADPYAIDTPATLAFDLIALDWTRVNVRSSWDYELSFRWARVTSDGVEEDTVLDIDFVADAVEPTAFVGAFELPSSSRSPLGQSGAHPWLQAFAGSSYWVAPAGYETSIRRNGDLVEYTGELVEASHDAGLWYAYLVEADADSSTEPISREQVTVAYGRGVPTGQQPQLLDLPEWVTEPQNAQGHPIDQPLSWEPFNEDVRTWVWVSAGDDVLWIVQVPEGSTEVILPSPPSNVDLAELLDPSPSAMIALERQIDSEEGVFWLESWGTELDLDLGE